MLCSQEADTEPAQLSELIREIVQIGRLPQSMEENMSLFNRPEKEEVPEIEVQGDEGVIPKPEGEEGKDKKTKKVKFTDKIWGRN